MESLLSGIRLQASSDPLWQHLLHAATQAFVAFTFVAMRLAGMAFVGPMFGSPGMPARLRLALVAAIAVVVTPALITIDSQREFARLDGDHDGRLFISDVAPSMHPQFRRMIAEAGKLEVDSLSASEFRLSPAAPRSLVEYAWLGLMEFAVGLALGTGVMIVLSAAQMAGSLIDQQLGLSMGEIFNPQLGIETGQSGQMLHQLGLVVFLLAGGHLMLVSALLDTFVAMPLGYAWMGQPVFDMLRDLVSQSLILTIQVAAPVLAALAVVGLAVGFVGRALPQLDVLALSLPVRLLVGFLVLGLSLAGIGDLIGSAVPDAVLEVRRTLMGLSGGIVE